MEDQWISVRTAARIVGVSHNTLRGMIRRGEVPELGKVDGRIIVLSRAQIEALAERRARTGRSRKAA